MLVKTIFAGPKYMCVLRNICCNTILGAFEATFWVPRDEYQAILGPFVKSWPLHGYVLRVTCCVLLRGTLGITKHFSQTDKMGSHCVHVLF